MPREPQPLSGQFLAGTSKVDFPTPLAADQVLTDFVASTAADYLELATGTSHLDFVKWPKHRLVKQVPIDWQTVQRIYAADRAPAEDSYNATPGLSSESNAHPVFVRDYLVRRWRYSPLAKGSILRGIVGTHVLNEGDGYTQETVSATLSGGLGSGGVLRPIVSNGRVVEIAILDQGSYSVAPAITIADSKDGTGATASCFMQPPEAILTGEETMRLTDSPLDGLFIMVRRTYETLPGPDLPFTRYDDQLGPVQGRRRAVVNTGQAASLSGIAKKTYEARDGSSYVSWEIEENWSDGTGSEGNPAYPIRISDDYDNDRGPFQIIEQVVARVGNEEGSIVEVDGLITKITYVPINEFLLERRIETWAVPGPELVKRNLGQESLIPAKYRRLITTEETRTHVAADTPMPGALVGDQTSFEIDQQSEAHAVQTVVEEVIAVDEDPLPGSYTDEQGVITTEESVVVDGTAADSGFQIKSSKVDPFGNGKSAKKVETYPAFAPQYGTHIDEATGIRVDFTKIIVANGATGGVSGSNYVEVQTGDKWRSIQITNVLNVASLPAAYTYAAQIKHSFPNVIEDGGMVPYYAYSGDLSDLEMGVLINDIQGYAGPCTARITERYLTAAAYASYTAPAITKFWPEDYQFGHIIAWPTRATVTRMEIPVSLHPAKNLVWPFVTIAVPATNPTTLPFGSYIYVAVEPERWRFGVWKVTEIEVLVPTL